MCVCILDRNSQEKEMAELDTFMIELSTSPIYPLNAYLPHLTKFLYSINGVILNC